MVREVFLTAAMIFLASPSFAQDECAGLAPVGGEEVTESFKGSIKGEVEGIISKLAGGSASIEGEYRRLERDTLQDYPDANKVFVWRSIIYLACVRPNAGIDINSLFELYLNGPPSTGETPIQGEGISKAVSLITVLTPISTIEKYLGPPIEQTAFTKLYFLSSSSRLMISEYDAGLSFAHIGGPPHLRLPRIFPPDLISSEFDDFSHLVSICEENKQGHYLKGDFTLVSLSSCPISIPGYFGQASFIARRGETTPIDVCLPSFPSKDITEKLTSGCFNSIEWIGASVYPNTIGPSSSPLARAALHGHTFR